MAFTLKTKTTNKRNNRNSDDDEFAGIFINVGVVTEEPLVEANGKESEETFDKFNRLPRGIAVSDLIEHRIYANTEERNPEWAKEAQIVNALIEKIREVSAGMEEGEAKPAQLSVQIYKRQEQVESVAGSKTVEVNLDSLF